MAPARGVSLCAETERGPMTDTPQPPTLAEQIAWQERQAQRAGDKPNLYQWETFETKSRMERAVLATLQQCESNRERYTHAMEAARVIVEALTARVERMEAVVEAAREVVAAIQSVRHGIDAAMIRLSVANHLISRLAALDAAAPEADRKREIS